MIPHLEKALLILGLASISIGASQLVRFERFQLNPMRSAAPTAHIVGELDISRIQLRVPVLDNDDEQSLELSVGHIPGTAAIGSLGNAGVAGHRDTAFRPLRQVRIGDRIETHTGQDAVYVVTSIRVVKPEDTSVLHEGSAPTLTLITCYPFYYVGPAPLRLVVQAQMATR